MRTGRAFSALIGFGGAISAASLGAVLASYGGAARYLSIAPLAVVLAFCLLARKPRWPGLVGLLVGFVLWSSYTAAREHRILTYCVQIVVAKYGREARAHTDESAMCREEWRQHWGWPR